MLERRVSNNRADLNGDQQLNYFLAWFQSWSDLQKTDFVPILASKLTAASNSHIITVPDMNGLSVNDNEKKRPLSLFQCQLKLFKDWIVSWKPDQQEYLLLRLKDLDSNFFAKYEEYLECGEDDHAKPKDYFEPGVPPELVRASRKSSSTSSSPNVSLNGDDHEDKAADSSNNEDGPDREPLSTIQEDE